LSVAGASAQRSSTRRGLRHMAALRAEISRLVEICLERTVQ
jgi:hypothetical protein